ncbi:hypothetical protein AB0I81_11065 [Nonomuraea sp. NPDC050404]|uniref:hypothetical protein n=1 Tax=Nonomuraea sp. NPDC050404 TaxID=3155783 RepID=UPI0033E2D5EE
MATRAWRGRRGDAGVAGLVWQDWCGRVRVAGQAWRARMAGRGRAQGVAERRAWPGKVRQDVTDERG